MVSKSFFIDDQLRFAALSGDANPMHVDAVIARRTIFGEPVVHGIHALLWALDEALCRSGIDHPMTIEKLRVEFLSPLVLDRTIVLDFDARDATFALRAEAAGKQVLVADVTLATASPADRTLDWCADIPASTCRDMAFSELASAAGRVPVRANPDLLMELFPRLAMVAPGPACELLAMSRLVGMECPGLHSLFVGLEVSRVTDANPDLVYAVRSANETYSAVRIEVRGPTLGGHLATFFRPPPVPPVSIEAVRARITPGQLRGHRAIVIGGSRGLGEACAMLIGIGGGDVCVTYHRGRAEAEAVSAAIHAAGGKCDVLELDCRAPGNLASRWSASWAPDHMYFFATPRIVIDPAAQFDAERFHSMIRYYVDGLYATTRAVKELGAKTLSVMAPSTAFLDAPDVRGAAAYCAAKAAMEELARHMPRMLGATLACPRLVPTRTDQTAGLVRRDAADAIDVMLGLITNRGA